MKNNRIVMFCAVLLVVMGALAVFGIASAREMTPEQRATIDRLRGSNVSDRSSVLGTATEQLLRAVQSEHVNARTIERLIEAGADVNAKDEDGRTALMLIAEANHRNSRNTLREAIAMLIKYGADVNAKDNYGRTALMSAHSNAEATKALIKTGANVNARDEGGYTALMGANNAEVAKALIKAGADVNARTEGGFTALMRASQSFYGSLEVAQVLIKAGAKVNARDEVGRTALIYAVDSNSYHSGEDIAPDPEIVSLLIKAGANVNIKEKEYGKTALMYAIDRLYFPEAATVAQLLIKSGADVNIKDKEGKTALDYVQDYDDETYNEVRKILQDAMKKK